MSISVVPYWFRQAYNGSSVELCCLKRVADSQDLYSEADLAKEVEESTSLTAGDFEHALGVFMKEMRKVLVRGNRVKIRNLGTFYMTVSSDSHESEEDLSVRDIKRVNIRFLPDKALKLVNNAVATTRSDNNVSFAIKGAALADDGSGGNTGEDGEGEYIDPNA